MRIYEPKRLVLSPICVLSFGLVMLFASSACNAIPRGGVTGDTPNGAAQLRRTPSPTLAATSEQLTPTSLSVVIEQPGITRNVTPSAVQTATAVVSATNDGWKTYRSAGGGYAVDYPATWKVEERVGVERALITTFTPSSGVGITVFVHFSKLSGEDNSDVMNLHCQAVTLSGLPATTCIDTISFSLTTALLNQGKTYAITTSRKGGDQKIYDRMLASFRIIP